MAEAEKSAVTISSAGVYEVKHTMKAARLLYSAPPIVLRGPIYMVFVISISAVVYSFLAPVPNMIACPMVLKKDETKIQAPTGGIVSRINVTPGARFETLTNLIDIQFKTDPLNTSARENLQEQLDRLLEKQTNLKEGKEKLDLRIKGLTQTLEATKKKLEGLDEEDKKEDLEFDAQLKGAESMIEIKKKDVEQTKESVQLNEKLLVTRKEAMADAEKSLKEEQALLEKKQSTTLQVQAMKDQLRAVTEALVSTQSSLDQAKKEQSKAETALVEARDGPNRLKNQQSRQKDERKTRRASLNEQISQLNFQIAEMELTSKQDKESLEREIGRVRESIKEAGTLTTNYKLEGEYCRVFSPYGGFVTQVYAKTGQQVGGGEVVMSVIKETEPLYARILVQNRDIGRLRTGQEVKIKYDAYPYQEFGIQKGSIFYISTTPSELKEEESLYEVKVSLEKKTVTVGAKERDLTIGLRGLADIKTGERKLIEVVFTPISKWLGSNE